MHQEHRDISTSKSAPETGAASSTNLDEGQCKFSGPLKIRYKSKKIGKRKYWKNQYVVISEGYLFVYSDVSATTVKMSHPMCDFERVTAYENNDTFMLTFREASKQPIVCSCKTSSNRREWVRQIDNAIFLASESDSGFERGEMLQNKTSDLKASTLTDNEDFHLDYPTVDDGSKTKQEETERTLSVRTEDPKDEPEGLLASVLKDLDKLDKAKQSETETRKDPKVDSEEIETSFKEKYELLYKKSLPAKSQNMSKPNQSRTPTHLRKEGLPTHTIGGRTQSTYGVDGDGGCHDQFSESSTEERKYEPVRYRKGTGLGLERIKSSPSVMATENQMSFLRTKSSPSMITGFVKPFMHEPHQTGMTANVEVERLQTDKKEIIREHDVWAIPVPYRDHMLTWIHIQELKGLVKPLMSEPCPYFMTERLQRDKKESWRNCYENSKQFKNCAKRLLLEEGSLPDQRLFQTICKEYGRKSEIIRNISNGICQNIKKQSNNIVHVWPAYRFKTGMDCSESQIEFVVITNKETQIQSEYQICQRHLNEISSLSKNENKRLHDTEKLYDLKSDDIALYLKSKAKQLMETHKNLTWVTVSVIKSSRHDKNDHRMAEIPCLALYVQIKGLIPINEDPFEQFLDGYPVDVREGVFSLYGLPTDLHQNVRMGCALDSGFGTKQGTVGPFLKYKDDLHTYLLTSAHVLLDPEQMKKLIVDTKVYYGMLGTDTYQPPESISVKHNSRHHLGKLEFAVYRTGEQCTPGMEVALVRIDNQRVPIDGKFPANEINDDYKLSLDDIGSYSEVYKYGSVTGLTKGKVRFIGGSVRSGTLYDHSLGMDITLHEQIEVESTDGVPFGEPGDSGALVFRKDEDTLFAIGIFEGRINDTYMVTPIRGIIAVLSEFMSLYRDPPTDTRMDFDEQTSNITLKLHHVPYKNVPLSGGIYRHISAEISRQTKEVQTNILHHTEHKFDSVKAELTAIKRHIDTSIDNSKREIIDSVCGHISSLLPTLNNT